MQDKASSRLDHSALHMLHRASQVADELFAAECPSADLTPRQYAVLAVLEGLQAASQTDIVEATGIDRSTLADIVKRLVKRGLVSRRRSRVDARAYVVKLTPEGTATLDEVAPATKRVDDKLLEALGPQRRQDLIASLATILGSIEASDRRRNVA